MRSYYTPEHFWNRVDRSGGPTACWPWLAARNRKGYGWVRWHDRPYTAHRIAFLLTYNHWPTPCCLHICDERLCCNPAHLWEGTNADNTHDMDAKGRRRVPCGTQHGMAKLTDEKVAEMRRLYATGKSQSVLAREYGVAQTTVSQIILRKVWKHVT